ncbi:TBC1 domain family member 17-like isoform X2 [Strigops habroptila]|uniref:TBC1 domain family member 17-like isoform X2 n=1 Tax=Strigops habroptila TaxID=2489341 RepID=UPI0011CEDF63|nr:TBC1 domain family member 17-like isoform X2 [Strigops habroptila]
MEAAGERVLLEVPGVSIHPRLRPCPPHRDGLVRGRLRVLEGADGLVLHWEPLEGPGEAPEDTEGAEPPDPGGRSLDPEQLRGRIFRGGLSPEVRPQGWRLLLGGDNEDPRERRDSYFRMKLQWRSLSPGQLQRNRLLRRYRHRLERDLARCHRDASSQQRALLHDVLMTYCMYHFDLGYVRGMSELLPPLLCVTPDEVEAFWGFSSIMELVGSSFGPTQERLKQQLGEVGQLLGVLEPRLEAGGTLRCCSRWLQLRFQPLLGLEGTLRLWEVLWTGLPGPNFLLLLVCALLELSVDTGHGTGNTGNSTGNTGNSTGDSGDSEEDEEDEEDEDADVPPHPGDTGRDRDGDGEREEGPRLDPELVLSRAEGFLLQLKAAPDLPPALRELLGLGGPPPSPPRTPPATPPPAP